MAPPAPLVALQDATVGFGGRPLFAGLSLGLQRGERLCLVGRNGCGKSTLLRTLAGEQPLDGGARVLQPGIKVAYLSQDPAFDAGETLADHIAGGLSEPHAGHRVEALVTEIGLPATAELARLSGGERRRAAIARALIGAPDILLLDEPTNHLDLPGIDWLESRIARFRGALLVISHDRTFLKRAVSATLWLDRGALKRLDKPFAEFEDWVQNEQAQEAEAQHKLDRQIVREEKWLQRGVTARRKRNQGRLRRLQELRQNRRDWLQAPGSAKLSAALAEGGGKLVIEAKGIGKSYRGADGQEHRVVTDFSTRLRRGERLGIIGANGAGKTTLARLLIGDLAPDSGSVKLGSNLQTLYFDQRRDSLDPEATLWETLVPGGGDSISVQGRQRHVVSYLRDFLFDENQARQPVRKLSGGERNRLLLARLFARPANLLVLDEPTNDLDLETLDLLEEVLSTFEGTLLLVSHDRDFLDRLVTGVLLVEGGGRVTDFAGGYSDAMLARQQSAKTEAAEKRKPASEAPRQKPARAKLSYKEQRALELLPVEIDKLTAAIARLEGQLADPGYYERDPAAFGKTAQEVELTRAKLAAAEEEWLLLEERREQLATGGGA